MIFNLELYRLTSYTIYFLDNFFKINLNVNALTKTVC